MECSGVVAADTPQTSHVHQNVASLCYFVVAILDVRWITVPKTFNSIWLRPQTRTAQLALVLPKLWIKAAPIHTQDTIGRLTMRRTVLTLISAAFMAACGSTGTDPAASVAIKFGTAGSGASPSSVAMFSVAGGQADDVPGHITGSNGELNLTAIWVIVEEFELEPVESADCDDDLGTDDCPDFEQKYFFIDVPLDGTTVTVVSTEIPDGTYDELEFEVDDVEVDADDPEEVADADLIAALLVTVRNRFENWPDKASMVVTGTWTPTGGSAVSFETYFDADIEVEIDLVPVLTVADGVASRELTILLRPASWFLRADGTVWNLKDIEGELVDFDLEIEDGFELKID